MLEWWILLCINVNLAMRICDNHKVSFSDCTDLRHSSYTSIIDIHVHQKYACTNVSVIVFAWQKTLTLLIVTFAYLYVKKYLISFHRMFKCGISRFERFTRLYTLSNKFYLCVNTFLLHTILHTLIKIGTCNCVKHRREGDSKNVRLFNASLFDTNVN
jgi:hypothetical protein